MHKYNCSLFRSKREREREGGMVEAKRERNKERGGGRDRGPTSPALPLLPLPARIIPSKMAPLIRETGTRTPSPFGPAKYAIPRLYCIATNGPQQMQLLIAALWLQKRVTYYSAAPPCSENNSFREQPNCICDDLLLGEI